MSNQPEDQMAAAVVGELLDTTLEKTDDLKLYDEVIALNERGGLNEEEAALQQKVDAALDRAVQENGYTNIVTWDAISLAVDLVDCNEEFNDYVPSSLLQYTRSWRDRNGGDMVEVKWEQDHFSSKIVKVPRAALAIAETSLVVQLTAYGNSENKRANANALETMRLGRQLSITGKALAAVVGVLEACKRLRRFDGTNDGNPLNAAAKGYLCLQDSKDLDDAITKALQAMQQLEKEYPKAE